MGEELLILLTARNSILECTFNPPITLDPQKTNRIGLVSFAAYNSIPNIDETNNIFHYDDNKQIVFPTGCYEVETIADYLKEKLTSDNISLKPNNSTMQCVIKSKYKIDFSKPNSIGPVLGFGPYVLPPDKEHQSDQPINIMTVNMILINVNIASGSYVNGKPSHTIYAFSPSVPPGYKMIQFPRTMIYSRINTPYIDHLQVNIVDQSGRAVNFAGEEAIVLLHIKSDG